MKVLANSNIPINYTWTLSWIIPINYTYKLYLVCACVCMCFFVLCVELLCQASSWPALWFQCWCPNAAVEQEVISQKKKQKLPCDLFQIEEANPTLFLKLTNCTWKRMVRILLLMVQKSGEPVEVGSLSHYLQDFNAPQVVSRISSIKSSFLLGPSAYFQVISALVSGRVVGGKEIVIYHLVPCISDSELQESRNEAILDGMMGLLLCSYSFGNGPQTVCNRHKSLAFSQMFFFCYSWCFRNLAITTLDVNKNHL